MNPCRFLTAANGAGATRCSGFTRMSWAFGRIPSSSGRSWWAGEKYAVALLHFTVTAKSSGKRFETHIAEVTEFDDAGKMASMRIHYFDTAHMVGQLNAESVQGAA